MAEKTTISVAEQVEKAMDGRTQRWLSLEAKIPESELSRKMNGVTEFTDEEITRINEVLKSKIKK
jgi:plasmid maintenance system antidote protein VapI